MGYSDGWVCEHLIEHLTLKITRIHETNMVWRSVWRLSISAEFVRSAPNVHTDPEHLCATITATVTPTGTYISNYYSKIVMKGSGFRIDVTTY